MEYNKNILKIGVVYVIFDIISERCRTLCRISSYLIYIFTFLSLIGHFATLGGFIDAVLYYLFFGLILLGVAARDYVSLGILFLGKFILNMLDVFLIFTRDYSGLVDSYDLWKFLFGLIINGILTYICFKISLNFEKGETDVDR